MSELFNAREQSHATRQQVGHKVYITGKGASYTPPPPPPSFKYQLSRGIIGGLRDTAQGAIDIRNEVASILEPFAEAIPTEARDAIITSLMGFTTPRADDSVQEVPGLPEVDAPDAGVAEGLLRGLVQFGAGAAAAPIKGAGMVAQMGRGAVADALFDPEDGNLSTMLKEFGLEGAVLDFLDSQVDGDAGAEERLQARVMQSLEGAGLGALVDGAMAGFRAIRSDEGLVETVRQSLAETGAKAKAAFDAIPVDSNTMYSNPMVAAVDAAKAAYEAAPNDPQLRIDYFDLRKQRDADPVAQAQPPTDAEPGIIAFHGSAADFDQFRLEKIGTGEGAQMYGYGLYFADKEAIADFYRGALTDAPYDYKIDGQSVSEMYRNAVYAENYELADVLEQVQLHDTPKTLKAKFTVENGYAQETADFVADLDYDKLTGVDFDGKEIPLGRIYKVGLTPKPDDLLDYDKAFSEQTPAIQAALKKAGYKDKYHMVALEDGDGRFGVYETDEAGKRTFVKHFSDGLMGMSAEAQANEYIKEVNATLPKNTGGQILDVLASDLAKKATAPASTRLDEINTQLSAIAEEMRQYETPGAYRKYTDPKGDKLAVEYDALMDERANLPKFKRKDARRLASEALENAGIPGIKYRDGASRGNNIEDAAADRNYVIFDDSMIKILEKYGIVGPVAISAAAASKGGQKDDET